MPETQASRKCHAVAGLDTVGRPLESAETGKLVVPTDQTVALHSIAQHRAFRYNPNNLSLQGAA
jgi:hypothetical protein